MCPTKPKKKKKMKSLGSLELIEVVSAGKETGLVTLLAIFVEDLAMICLAVGEIMSLVSLQTKKARAFTVTRTEWHRVKKS